MHNLGMYRITINLNIKYKDFQIIYHINKIYLSLLASSMNGRFCPSVNNFHSAPNRFDISELCIFGLSCAIFRRCPLDQTINAFIGRFICSDCAFKCADIMFDLYFVYSLSARVQFRNKKKEQQLKWR